MTGITSETIAAREAELRKIIREATAELEELPAVKRYIARLEAAAGKVPEPAEPQPPEPVPLTASAPPEGAKAPEAQSGRLVGLSKAIVDVLSSAEDPWMTAKQIQAAASALLGTEVRMSSISPKLSDMKTKGTIRRDDMHVALTSRAHTIDDLLR